MMYTPIKLPLKDVFEGYTDAHYIILKPIPPGEIDTIQDLVRKNPGTPLAEVAKRYVKYFEKGTVKTDKGEVHNMTPDDFITLFPRIAMHVRGALFPASASEAGFTNVPASS